MQTRYVNTASTVGTQDGTTNTAGSSGTAAFATLRQALDSLGTLTDAYTIYCTGTAADTSDVGQSAWDFTTSAANYLLITTQGADRPGTTYSTSKYRIERTNSNGLYQNIPEHVRIDGIQVKITANDGASYIAFKTTNANQSGSAIDMRITNCIAWAVQSGGSHVTGYEVRPTTGGTVVTNVIANCVAIDCYYGYGGDVSTASFYNCGAYYCTYGFVADAAWTIKNCLATNATSEYVGSFSGSSNYNAGTDGSAPGANSRPSTSFTFTNAAGDDFSLTSGDSGARDYGTDLHADSYYAFSTDIAGNARPDGAWDIGPFEYIPAATVVTPNPAGLST